MASAAALLDETLVALRRWYTSTYPAFVYNNKTRNDQQT